MQRGKPVKIVVHYDNIGREPALDVSFDQAWRAIPAPTAIDWADFSPGPNTTCESAIPKNGSVSAFPRYPGDYEARVTFQELVFNDAIAHRLSIFYAIGCVAYKTFGAVHKSAYCFYLDPSPGIPSQEWRYRLVRLGIR